MDVVGQLKRWMFAPQPPSVSCWRVILWWELRRIPYNIFVALYGAFCLLIFFAAIATSGHLAPGEDAVEPIALLVAPVAVNLCYTLGWLVEVPTRWLLPHVSRDAGAILLKMGICLSMILISLPAVFWGGYRLLQLLHVLG